MTIKIISKHAIVKWLTYVFETLRGKLHSTFWCSITYYENRKRIKHNSTSHTVCIYDVLNYSRLRWICDQPRGQSF